MGGRLARRQVHHNALELTGSHRDFEPEQPRALVAVLVRSKWDRLCSM
jgi:hypothetical protein